MRTVTKADLGVTGLTRRPFMQPGEQDVLLTLIASVTPRVMVEIGVNDGLTAQAVLRRIDSIERYIGIDVDPTYRFELPAQQIEHTDRPGHLVRADARFQLVLRGAELPTSADVVFIDGDHGKRAVRADSHWAADIVAPGGLIVWHDYGNASVEVTGVLNQLCIAGRDICHVSATWLAFEHR